MTQKEEIIAISVLFVIFLIGGLAGYREPVFWLLASLLGVILLGVVWSICIIRIRKIKKSNKR